jgi:hypothetical protein
VVRLVCAALVVDESEQGRSTGMDLAVGAAEGQIVEELSLRLAGGGADEAPGVVRRGAQECVADSVIGQLRRWREAPAARRTSCGSGGIWVQILAYGSIEF